MKRCAINNQLKRLVLLSLAVCLAVSKLTAQETFKGTSKKETITLCLSKLKTSNFTDDERKLAKITMQYFVDKCSLVPANLSFTLYGCSIDTDNEVFSCVISVEWEGGITGQSYSMDIIADLRKSGKIEGLLWSNDGPLACILDKDGIVLDDLSIAYKFGGYINE